MRSGFFRALYIGSGEGSRVHWDTAPIIRCIYWRARINSCVKSSVRTTTTATTATTTTTLIQSGESPFSQSRSLHTTQGVQSCRWPKPIPTITPCVCFFFSEGNAEDFFPALGLWEPWAAVTGIPQGRLTAALFLFNFFIFLRNVFLYLKKKKKKDKKEKKKKEEKRKMEPKEGYKKC